MGQDISIAELENLIKRQDLKLRQRARIIERLAKVANKLVEEIRICANCPIDADDMAKLNLLTEKYNTRNIRNISCGIDEEEMAYRQTRGLK